MNTSVEPRPPSTAYHSDSKAPLPPPKWAEDNNRSGGFDTHLAFGNYAYLEPEMEVTTQLQADEANILQHQKERGYKEEVYCDARSWRFQNSSKIPHFLFVSKLMCHFFATIAWGTGITVAFLPTTWRKDIEAFYVLCSSLVTVAITIFALALFMDGKKTVHRIQLSGFFILSAIVYWKENALWGNSDLHRALWIGACLYFMGAIGIDVLLFLHNKISVYDGSEFNRTDGMLRFKRRFRRMFVAPFEEFDPVLQLLPSGYGSHDYALWLHHRYTDNKICLAVKLHSLGLDRNNALAFWDCLQRYMDITQPLPDLPVLEQSRHLDPTTVIHDTNTGRNPRRWRDQARRGWIAGGLKTLSKQLEEYPWQSQPCIVKARIDRSLSIEAYYRAQEAKGIYASPKADDFDDVHRP